MKLREFKFRELTVPGLSIFVDDKEVASGFIGEVLNDVVHLADHEIKSTNYFFDMFVIRLWPIKRIDLLGNNRKDVSIMRYRFYINADTLYFRETNLVITPDGKEIEYSYMCSNKDSFPPDNCGYKLVYENEEGNFRIKYGDWIEFDG